MKMRNNNFFGFFVVRAQKSETAINQTPISSIGRKAPPTRNTQRLRVGNGQTML